MSAISSLQYNWQLTGAGGENRALSSFQSLETIQREKHRNQQPKDKARSAEIPDQATKLKTAAMRMCISPDVHDRKVKETPLIIEVKL